MEPVILCRNCGREIVQLATRWRSDVPAWSHLIAENTYRASCYDAAEAPQAEPEDDDVR